MKRCPRPDCLRAGPDVGKCADKVLGCPVPLEVDPAKDVVIRCEPCGGRTVAIPAGELMSGRRNPFNCMGSTDKCKAEVVLPSSKGKSKRDLPPPPLRIIPA